MLRASANTKNSFILPTTPPLEGPLWLADLRIASGACPPETPWRNMMSITHQETEAVATRAWWRDGSNCHRWRADRQRPACQPCRS